jgi:hypothetical protein
MQKFEYRKYYLSLMSDPATQAVRKQAMEPAM